MACKSVVCPKLFNSRGTSKDRKFRAEHYYNLLEISYIIHTFGKSKIIIHLYPCTAHFRHGDIYILFQYK
jgi:hypothetical protein